MGMDRFSNLILRTTTRVFNVDDKNFVTYIPRKGSRFKIQAIFDGPFEQVDPDTEVLVASNQYTLGVKLADLPFPPCKGDRVSVRSVSYLVVDSQEDGQGGSEMILHRQC